MAETAGIAHGINYQYRMNAAVQVEFEDGTYGQAFFSKCMIGHKNDLRVTVSGENHEYAWEQQQCDRFFIGNREKGNETVYMNTVYNLQKKNDGCLWTNYANFSECRKMDIYRWAKMNRKAKYIYDIIFNEYKKLRLYKVK